MSLEPISPLVFQAMQREIGKMRRQLATQQAIIDRLTSLPAVLPTAPLHKPGKIGNVISDRKTIRSE